MKKLLIVILFFSMPVYAENTFTSLAGLESQLASEVQKQLLAVFGDESTELQSFSTERETLQVDEVSTNNEAYYSIYLRASQQLTNILWGKQYPLEEGVHYEKILIRIEAINTALFQDSQVKPSG